MTVSSADVRSIVERVCARPDVLDACAKRDLGAVITALGSAGITQGQISALTEVSQGRLSEWKTGKREPKGVSTFQKFADGVGLPAAARLALGLAADGAYPEGASTPDARITLSYPDGVTEATENVSSLWRADLADASAFLRGRFDPRAWGDASLRWLVDPGRTPERQPARGVRIGTGDVTRFRATVDMFAALDDRFGGGHAREALIKYLSIDGDRLLRGQYSDAVGRELFSAVAEATLLAAWMTYDSAPTSAMAQGYFVQALSLAQAGSDRLLGASILDAMSHQATFAGKFTDAANLARASLTGTRGIAPPTLTAHFHAMEARALARLGDAKSCSRALSESMTEFDRANPEDAPAWMQYFNDSELSAEFGHCMRDLGRASDAVQYADSSLKASEAAFGRSDFFVSIVLADAQLAAGDAEQACTIALKAISSGDQIRSARCVSYLREFARNLPANTNGPIADFREQAGSSRLWRIASRPDKALA
jgi:transcriptional regulator with XRE-family HTH domain/tetratricopeptide (TPR) repeat protein